MTRRKHADMIHAWAEGAQIQVHYPHYPKDTWVDDKTPNWYEYNEYRVKPQYRTVTIKYRRFITSACCGNTPAVFCLQYDQRDKYNPAAEQGFVRWIDNDWVETSFTEEI